MTRVPCGTDDLYTPDEERYLTTVVCTVMLQRILEQDPASTTVTPLAPDSSSSAEKYVESMAAYIATLGASGFTKRFVWDTLSQTLFSGDCVSNASAGTGIYDKPGIGVRAVQPCF
jgi:hypothetical protein